MLYRGATLPLDMASGSVVAVDLPQGSREHLIRLVDSTVAWEASFSEAVLLAGKGTQLAAGESFTIDAPVSRCYLYIRQSGGSAEVASWTYLYPSGPR